MSITSKTTAVWNGDLKNGFGKLEVDESALSDLSFTWEGRSKQPDGNSTPEELLGAAHAACFSMALSNALAPHGSEGLVIRTDAEVTFDPSEGITGSHLTVSIVAPEITAEDCFRLAEEAKLSCPISRALVGIPITLEVITK